MCIKFDIPNVPRNFVLSHLRQFSRCTQIRFADMHNSHSPQTCNQYVFENTTLKQHDNEVYNINQNKTCSTKHENEKISNIKDVRKLKPHLRSHYKHSQKKEPTYPEIQIEVPTSKKRYIVYVSSLHESKIRQTCSLIKNRCIENTRTNRTRDGVIKEAQFIRLKHMPTA